MASHKPSSADADATTNGPIVNNSIEVLLQEDEPRPPKCTTRKRTVKTYTQSSSAEELEEVEESCSKRARTSAKKSKSTKASNPSKEKPPRKRATKASNKSTKDNTKKSSAKPKKKTPEPPAIDENTVVNGITPSPDHIEDQYASHDSAKQASALVDETANRFSSPANNSVVIENGASDNDVRNEQPETAHVELETITLEEPQPKLEENVPEPNQMDDAQPSQAEPTNETSMLEMETGPKVSTSENEDVVECAAIYASLPPKSLATTDDAASTPKNDIDEQITPATEDVSHIKDGDVTSVNNDARDEKAQNPDDKRATRSSIKRKQPTTQPVDLENDDYTPVAKKRNSIKTPAKPCIRYTKRWDPLLVVSDSKSILVKANLTSILQSDAAWDLLKPAQQRTLLALLPPAPTQEDRDTEAALLASVPEDDTVPLPDIARSRLRKSSAFKADVRTFQEDLQDGKLDPAWIEAATRASERRSRGEFDEWKVGVREMEWAMFEGGEE